MIDNNDISENVRIQDSVRTKLSEFLTYINEAKLEEATRKKLIDLVCVLTDTKEASSYLEANLMAAPIGVYELIKTCREAGLNPFEFSAFFRAVEEYTMLKYNTRYNSFKLVLEASQSEQRYAVQFHLMACHEYLKRRDWRRPFDDQVPMYEELKEQLDAFSRGIPAFGLSTILKAKLVETLQVCFNSINLFPPKNMILASAMAADQKHIFYYADGKGGVFTKPSRDYVNNDSTT